MAEEQEVPERYRGLPAGLAERIDNLPQEPGVYIMKNRRGEVIYVGKAVSLRSRVRSYFSGQDTRAFVSLLSRLLGDLETIVVRSEKEALLLEQTLIKQHRPRFNVVHRDDKSFITLAINGRHGFPRVEVMRTHTLQQQGHKPGHRYFGPYSSASSVRGTLRVLNQHFMLRTCTDHVLNNRTRPCLEYQIGRCLAPCVFDVSSDTYAQHVEDAVLFLSGKQGLLLEKLGARMQDAAGGERFEEAARLRDQLRDVERTTERQVMADSDGDDLDVLGLFRQGSTVALASLSVRSGRVTGKDTVLYTDAEFPDDELMLQVLDARYGTAQADEIPDEVLVGVPLPTDELSAREAHLSDTRGRRVGIHHPQRGDKKRLMEIAERNALEALEDVARRRETRQNALHRLQERLHLGRRPTVMECFDISLFQGAQPVASQVVFVEGAPEKARYRRYTVKSVEGTDDFAMMHEVILRRLTRGRESGDLPDLLVVDGGRGQLNAALAAFRDAGVPTTAAEAATLAAAPPGAGAAPAWPDAARWVELCSLAKARALDGRRGYSGRRAVTDDAAPEGGWDEGGEDGASRHSPERVFLPHAKDPVALKNNTAELHVMSALRDEAHRFAITFHRQRRNKATLRSGLDTIAGVGPARRKALLRHFGSLTAVRDATLEQLVAAPGVPESVARAVFQALHADAAPPPPEDATDAHAEADREDGPTEEPEDDADLDSPLA